MKKWKEAVRMYLSLEGSLFRYSLSFCVLLALLPTLIIGVLLFQNLVLNFQDVLASLYHFLPKELLQPFVIYVMDKDYPSLVSIVVALVAAIYIASKSFYSFILISASHEKFVTKNILLRMKSFIMFVLFLAGIIACALIAHIFHINVYLAFSIGLFTLFYALYRGLSFEKRPYIFGVAGALFSTVGILLVERLFLFVVSTFTTYQSVYGPLSSLVVMFLAIYIVSCVVYGGYCINQVYGVHNSQKIWKSKRFYERGETLLNRWNRNKKIEEKQYES